MIASLLSFGEGSQSYHSQKICAHSCSDEWVFYGSSKSSWKHSMETHPSSLGFRSRYLQEVESWWCGCSGANFLGDCCGPFLCVKFAWCSCLLVHPWQWCWKLCRYTRLAPLLFTIPDHYPLPAEKLCTKASAICTVWELWLGLSGMFQWIGPQLCLCRHYSTVWQQGGLR